ncbi:cytochrome c oxidase subunit 3 [Rhodoferax ferrireducens]|uniref:cytochrome c oxidase subunit 3 n=1 Tax=Rhodoferax ferrireducens TaxID=192843 RepID=UPI000E0D316E|nr:cytochrome c oxidase subunit 3 [Rhodoferax ferrireducens]
MSSRSLERPGAGDGSGTAAGHHATTRIPGELGIWMFVAGDLIVFSVFFILIALGQKEKSDLFLQSRVQLDLGAGLLNTLLLLTGSWFVAIGVQRCRTGLSATASRFFSLGILCGVGFVANKGLEWNAKFAHGINPATNYFFMYFFVFTGIHLLHVLVGIGVLFMLRSVSRNPLMNARRIRTLESGATFWHLVDLLWIVLFALLYLL